MLLDYISPRQAPSTHSINWLFYALAACLRLDQASLKAGKCAWFDEMDYFEFFPLEAVKARQTRVSA